MADWDAQLYLKFEDERTRPAADLLARVPVSDPRRCIDLGCGPGNSTELLATRYPNAEITGLDSSPDMLAKARARLPGRRFEEADLATWSARDAYDLVFANAVLQWLPDHGTLLPRLVEALRDGGCLAVQMPDNLDEPSHRLMREVARAGPWSGKLSAAAASRTAVGSFDDYYGRLRQAGCTVDLWRTTYVHPLDGPAAIVEWLTSTGLRPFLDPLDPNERAGFLRDYEARIAQAYPRQPDGGVLLRFPRLFIVARRSEPRS